MANPQTNKWCSKLFKGALKSKVKHSKRLEVKGQGEILTSQDLTTVADRPTEHTFVTSPCIGI